MASEEYHAGIDFKGSTIKLNGSANGGAARYIGTDEYGDLEYKSKPLQKQIYDFTVTGNMTANFYGSGFYNPAKFVAYEHYDPGGANDSYRPWESDSSNGFVSVTIYGVYGQVAINISGHSAGNKEIVVVMVG